MHVATRIMHCNRLTENLKLDDLHLYVLDIHIGLINIIQASYRVSDPHSYRYEEGRSPLIVHTHAETNLLHDIGQTLDYSK